MGQMQNTVITKDDIVGYVDQMKIKKSGIGGLDKNDVYTHIQEVIRMCGAYAEQELAQQKETLEGQQKEIEALQKENEELKKTKALLPKLQGMTETLDKKVRELNEELDQCKVYTQELEKETQIQGTEIQELKPYKELAIKLQKKEDLKEEESAAHVMEPCNYVQEIGELLREARQESRNIIDSARVEAEQELNRLLHLRAEYKQEKEVYQNWCKRVEAEKRMIEEFLKQLSAQYENVNGAFSYINERAASYDIKSICRAIETQQANTEEV